RANLIRKTGFNKIAALTRFAMRNGFVAVSGEHLDECQSAGTAHPDATDHVRWRPVITNGGPLAGCALKHSECPHFHLIDRRMKSVTPEVDRRATARAPAG
ncbi:MAG TPA: hypothetical protein VJQ83_08280, partial [Tepidiformaceae bacterium]|nr:hypothetical protein [Tepidiformaceae bacterium]